jgi:hypothetical protein
MFDYKSVGRNLDVPSEVINNFENEARNEFPLDDMLMELHTLRAIKSYARTNVKEDCR